MATRAWLKCMPFCCGASFMRLHLSPCRERDDARSKREAAGPPERRETSPTASWPKIAVEVRDSQLGSSVVAG